ncbi:MAG: hypothetical protein U1E65_34495 [Myxococcota bacterium]
MKARARTSLDAAALEPAIGAQQPPPTQKTKAGPKADDGFGIGGSGATKIAALPELNGAGNALALGAQGVPEPKTAAKLGASAGAWAKVGARIISSNDVEDALRTGDFSKFPVAPKPELLPMYQALSAALTAHGPNGTYGNGMGLGPVGDEPWNPSELFRGVGQHKTSADKPGAPGSEVGVFGGDGPAANLEKLDQLAPGLSEQLLPGGLFDGVGPLSRLGAYGDTGPVGPVGVHGLAQDEHGRFMRGNGVVRDVELMTAQGKKAFALVEKYDAETAAQMKDNDASWMIRGGLKPSDDRGQSFRFQVKKGDLVMLQVGSESLKDSFQIELLQNKKVIAKADSKTLLSTLRFQAQSDGRLEVRVKRMDLPPVTPSFSDLYIQAATAPVVIGFGMMKPFLELSGMKFKPHPEGAVYRLSCTSVSPGMPGFEAAAAKFNASGAS